MDILSDLNVVGKIKVNSDGVSTTIGKLCGMNGVITPFVGSRDEQLTILSDGNLSISSHGNFSISSAWFSISSNVDSSISSYGNLRISSSQGDIYFDNLIYTKGLVIHGNVSISTTEFFIQGKISSSTKNIEVLVPTNCTRFVIYKENIHGDLTLDHPLVTAYKDNKKVDLDIELFIDDSYKGVIGSMTACSSDTNLYVSML